MDGAGETRVAQGLPTNLSISFIRHMQDEQRTKCLTRDLGPLEEVRIAEGTISVAQREGSLLQVCATVGLACYSILTLEHHVPTS